MKTTERLGLAALAVMLGGGCTGTHALSVSAMNHAAPVYREGRPWLDSVKTNSVAVGLLTPKYKADLRDLLPPAFYVAVRNESRGPIEFSIDDIAVSSGGRTVRLITYREYRAEIVGLGEAWLRGVRQAGDRAKMESSDAEPWREKLIDNAARSMTAEITDRWKVLLDDARRMVDRRSYWLKPGEMAGGVVRLNPADVAPHQPLRLAVAIGGETYEFFFDAGK